MKTTIRLALPVALAVAVLAASSSASACPPSKLLARDGTLALSSRMWPVDEIVQARGPVLWSAEDVVDLRVVEHTDNYVVLKPVRPLEVGRLYNLGLSRDAHGHGLQRVERLYHQFLAVDAVPWSGDCAAHACGASATLFQKVSTFGLLPFLMSYALTTVIIIRRRRRALASL